MRNVTKKRIMKFKGFINFIYSHITLKYTKFHHKQLCSYFRKHPVEKLHIGCGNVILDSWLNIFYEQREKYGIVKTKNKSTFLVTTHVPFLLNYNLLKSWPFLNNSVLFIAGSHVIEHLDLNAGLKLAKESYRVLKKGGVMRLSCPDLEIYAKNYIDRNEKFFSHPKIREWCTFKASRTYGEIFAAKAYDSGNAHQWFYDAESLKHILEEAGFKGVRRVKRLEGKTPNLPELELEERELESVYIEGIKY